mmetsp:Transcript_39478/g.93663  ORF Transcript_39478/g.93663 Transcript_39478/m.93663 type:complete len:149 (+) Transcript_39478:46-492(+)
MPLVSWKPSGAPLSYGMHKDSAGGAKNAVFPPRIPIPPPLRTTSAAGPLDEYKAQRKGKMSAAGWRALLDTALCLKGHPHGGGGSGQHLAPTAARSLRCRRAVPCHARAARERREPRMSTRALASHRGSGKTADALQPVSARCASVCC